MSAIGRAAFTLYDTSMDCGDTDLESYKFPEILQTFYYLEMVATGVAVAVLGATLVYLIVVERLKKMIMFMEAHICVHLLLNQLFTLVAVLVSPCQPFSLVDDIDKQTFRRFCLAFSFLICYTNLAVFGWLAMLSGYSCWMATEACQLHIYNAISTSLEENTAAEDENGNDPRTAKMARKISRNELKNRRTPRFNSRRSFKELFDLVMGSPDHHGTGADRRHVSETLSDSDGITEEDADVVEEEEKTVREWLTVFFVEWFSRFHLRRGNMMIVVYCPVMLICGISMATVPALSGDDSVGALDEFCWPGTESGMFWYMLGFNLVMLGLVLYFHLKGIQMVRIIEGSNLKSLQSIDRWEKEREKKRLRGEAKKKDPMKVYYLHQSLGQMQIMSAAWLIASVKEMYMWGCIIPHATMTYVVAFTMLQDNVLHSKKFKEWYYWFRSQREYERRESQKLKATANGTTK